MKKYEFIKETIFFPEEGILAVGDLHIGYEHMLRQSGILIPERQVKDIENDLKNIIDKIKSKNYSLNKIVFLGDIKHFFSYEWEEKSNIKKLMDFLKDHLDEKNIIFIRGNHDTMSLGLDFKDHHVEGDILFTHGHKSHNEMFDSEINYIVAGHIHPSIIISDKEGVKKEAFKCFLEGDSRGKRFVIAPSFLGFAEGTPVNEYDKYYLESFFIVPKKDIMKFKIHVIGEEEAYDFGEIRKL